MPTLVEQVRCRLLGNHAPGTQLGGPGFDASPFIRGKIIVLMFECKCRTYWWEHRIVEETGFSTMRRYRKETSL